MAKRTTKKMVSKPRVNNKKREGARSSSYSAPAAEGKVLRELGEPRIANMSNGDVIITHSEMGAELVTGPTSAFSARGSALSPLNSSLFPWLSTVAGAWESYVFEDLEVIYMTDLGSNQTGAIYMAVDYDSYDSVPSNKRSLLAYRSAVRAEVWTREVRMKLKREDLHKRKSFYVSPDVNGGFFSSRLSSLSDEDLRLSVTGNLILATQGSTLGANVALGDVMIKYKIRLMTPQLGIAGELGYSLYADTTYSTGRSATYPFGEGLPQNSDGISVAGSPREFSNNGIYYDPEGTGNTVSAWGFSKASTTYAVQLRIDGSGLSGPITIAFQQGASSVGGISMVNATETRLLYMALVRSGTTLQSNGYYGSMTMTGLTYTTLTSQYVRFIDSPPYTNGEGGLTLSRNARRSKPKFFCLADSEERQLLEPSNKSPPYSNDHSCAESVGCSHRFRVCVTDCEEKQMTRVVCEGCGLTIPPLGEK